jgi:hypothetical protein
MLANTLLPWKSSITYFFRVSVCLRVLACACVCVSVALLLWHPTLMRHILLLFVAYLAKQHFSTLSHKRHDFREKFIYIKCFFF